MTKTQNKQPYVLITVSGGVADIAIAEGEVGIDILDFDDLEQTEPDKLRLSEREWEYLRKHDKSLFEFFASSYNRRHDYEDYT